MWKSWRAFLKGSGSTRIALVAPLVHKHGGPPQYVAALATALAPDHEVTIFSHSFEDLKDTNLRHRGVWAFGGVFTSSVTFSLASSVLLLVSRLKKAGRFDIVHAHGDYTAIADVITSHFCEAEGVERLRRQGTGVTLGERLQRRRTALLERGVVGLSKGKPLVVLSERMRREFLSHYGSLEERLFVIPSGVDSTRYTPANVPLYRDEIRRRHGVAEASALLLFVGGYWERKGVAQAIKALARLRYPDVTLMIVGKGNILEYQELARREGVEKRVVFTGPTEQTWKYYAACDIFLLPTLYEPFGLVILEAMAAGLPVVVSGDAGAAELVRDGTDALLLKDAGDVDEIAAMLELLLEDDGLRKRMGEEARRTALCHTWSRVAQRTVKVYQRVRKDGGY